MPVDFRAVELQSPWLAEQLLDNPVNSLKSLTIAAEKHDYALHDEKKILFEITVLNLPEPQVRSVRDLRSQDLHKLLCSTVEIEIASDVRPEIISSRYECPSCGAIIPILQLGQQIREPSRCGCGRKGKFFKISDEHLDTAILWVTEPLGEILGSANVRTRIRAELQGLALTKKELMRRLGPGVPVKISYIPNELPIILKTGGQSRRLDLNLKIVGIEVLDNYTFDLNFSEEEVENFDEAVKQNDFLDKLAKSAYPDHYGDEEIKLALLAQLVSGNFIERKEAEQLHILLSGDPGVGKTKNFLMRSVSLAPIAHLAQATNSSSAGLLGSAGMKDPYTNRQMFEPGVLPRHNRGLVAIDEISALKYEDLKALNEALAHGTVTIDKANIHAKAPADARVLGAANPAEGRFDDYTVINAQVLGIEPSLLDRFDCVFILRDRPNELRDQHIVDKMNGFDRYDNVFSDDWVKRFILYVRAQMKTALTPAVAEELKSYYVQLRAASGKGRLTVSPRQYGALRAMTICFAKLALRSETTHDDVVQASRVMEVMFREFGYDMSKLNKLVPRVHAVPRKATGDDGHNQKLGSDEGNVLSVPSEERTSIRARRIVASQDILLFLQSTPGATVAELLAVCDVDLTMKKRELWLSVNLQSLAKRGDIVENPAGTWRTA